MEKKIEAKKGVLIESAMQFCTDNGHYPQIFPLTIGDDFKLSSKPDIQFEIKKPRTVYIVIETFIGMCCDAQHYYARLEADGIEKIQYVTDKDGNKRKYYIGGYICKEYNNLPREKRDIWDYKYNIDIDCRVSEYMKNDDPNVWEDYEIGDKTNRFPDKQNAIDTAIMVASARFPGWEIVLNDTTL